MWIQEEEEEEGGVPAKNPFISGEIKTFFLHQLLYPARSHWDWLLNKTD